MKIEGLTLPKKLEFGNEAHIALRKRIEKRRQIREEGITCPCGIMKMKCGKSL